jgi:mersacidin/lichenicidin family type 2 lantibiotic
MRKVDIIRAWKDEEYRLSLTEEERAQLPPHPAGLIELDDGQLANMKGHGDKHTNPCYTQPRITCLPVPC